MSAYAIITNLLTSIASQAPLLIVWIAGAIAAMVRRRHHSKVSMLVLGGSAMLILSSLFMISLSAVLPMFYETLGYQTMSWMMTIIRIGESLFGAAANAAIILAAFIERPEARPDGG